VFIDDATGQLRHLAFVASESTFDYFRATRAYLEAHGKPLAFCSDRHGIFRVNRKGALRGDGMTQFGRALHARSRIGHYVKLRLRPAQAASGAGSGFYRAPIMLMARISPRGGRRRPDHPRRQGRRADRGRRNDRRRR
jgi:hypothetical protein